jgi:hypothetical protein
VIGDKAKSLAAEEQPSENAESEGDFYDLEMRGRPPTP